MLICNARSHNTEIKCGYGLLHKQIFETKKKSAAEAALFHKVPVAA